MPLPFFSIQRDAKFLRLELFGLKVKFSNRVRVEYEDGGPYGMYDLIKRHARIPYCVDSVLAQHGWMPDDGTCDIKLEKNKKLMLSWSARCQANWVRKSKVPCAVAGSPFIHFRRDNNITISPDAKGTVAFPSHTTAVGQSSYDIDQYCAELAALPPEFHPITICLYFLDIVKHHHDIQYKKHGFQVVSAGLGSHKDYCQKTYEILRKHKFATSNVPGSYTFYAVEMGLPFFVLGELPTLDNRDGADKQLPVGLLRFTDTEYGAITYKLFTEAELGKITDKQRDFVIAETGMDDCLSPNELNLALRKAAVETYYIADKHNRFVECAKYCFKNPFCTLKRIRFEKFLTESVKLLQSPADISCR